MENRENRDAVSNNLMSVNATTLIWRSILLPIVNTLKD